MENKDTELENDDISHIFDEHCNDAAERLQKIDKMIGVLNRKKIVLEERANNFYLDRYNYINSNYKRIMRNYILYPVLIFSGICFGIISVVSSKLVIFTIFSMLSLHFLIIRKIIPEIYNLSVYYFNKKYNGYFSSVDDIDRKLVVLCQERIEMEKRIEADNKKVTNSANISRCIRESNNRVKPYCRIRKRIW